MLYYVYVLKSITHETHYVGCSYDVDRRLKEHNSGKCRYTKGRKPWVLVYKESYKTLSEARFRGRYLKSGKGREIIKHNTINQNWPVV